jgi:predicted MFS family arabinose efflux permease
MERLSGVLQPNYRFIPEADGRSTEQGCQEQTSLVYKYPTSPGHALELSDMACEAVPTRSGWRVALFVCAAQFLLWVGANFWAALLPDLMRIWALSYGEAGWITAIYYIAYLLCVPILLTATDRIDAKTIYLFGTAAMFGSHMFFALIAQDFWSALIARVFAGVGEAGTFMVGLKLLADRIDRKQLSRAVASHAACISISAALSFILVDFLTRVVGWRGAFLVAGFSAASAGLIVLFFVLRRESRINTSENRQRLFDFRPIFSNRICAHL